MIPLIQLHNATLGYASSVVLARLDLQFGAGDFALIGGPNGGGKTTLLRSIAGIVPLLAGECQRRESIGEVLFGYVPQQGEVSYPLSLTAREVVEIGITAAQPWWRCVFHNRNAAVQEALIACDAHNFANKPFSALSGGQRQRVLLARALALNPSCLLLDEPTAGVDYASQLVIAQLLTSINLENAKTILLVTHEPAPFLGSVSRALWVQNGLCEEISSQEFSYRREG